MGISDLSSITLRKPEVRDAPEIWRLARRSANDACGYRYCLLLCQDFSATSVVAFREGVLIGFVAGYLRPRAPKVLFASQVAVDPEVADPGPVVRGMLDTLIGRAELSGLSHFETSIRQSDDPARALLREFARERGIRIEFSVLFGEWEFPVQHETEVLCRVGPLPVH